LFFKNIIYTWQKLNEDTSSKSDTSSLKYMGAFKSEKEKK